jgi:hypothetical protein
MGESSTFGARPRERAARGWPVHGTAPPRAPALDRGATARGLPRPWLGPVRGWSSASPVARRARPARPPPRRRRSGAGGADRARRATPCHVASRDGARTAAAEGDPPARPPALRAHTPRRAAPALGDSLAALAAHVPEGALAVVLRVRVERVRHFEGSPPRLCAGRGGGRGGGGKGERARQRRRRRRRPSVGGAAERERVRARGRAGARARGRAGGPAGRPARRGRDRWREREEGGLLCGAPIRKEGMRILDTKDTALPPLAC